MFVFNDETVIFCWWQTIDRNESVWGGITIRFPFVDRQCIALVITRFLLTAYRFLLVLHRQDCYLTASWTGTCNMETLTDPTYDLETDCTTTRSTNIVTDGHSQRCFNEFVLSWQLDGCLCFSQGNCNKILSETNWFIICIVIESVNM